jgi:putative flippase GtrA
MKMELITVILCVLSMTITSIVVGIITKKDLNIEVLIAMIIAFVVTRAVIFAINKKKQKIKSHFILHQAMIARVSGRTY